MICSVFALVAMQNILAQGPYALKYDSINYYKPNGTTAKDAKIVEELKPHEIIYETERFINSYPNFEILAPASSRYNCFGYAFCITEGSDTVNLGYNGSADIVDRFVYDNSSVGSSFSAVTPRQGNIYCKWHRWSW